MKAPVPSRVMAPLLATLAFASTVNPVSAADPRRPDLSFVVHTLKEENVEGPDVERTYFMADARRIVFGKPKGCRLSIEGGGLLILPTDPGLDGEIRVGRSSFTPESDLAQDVLQYREAAAKGIPAGATRVEVKQPLMDTYPYNGWRSLGFTWTYVFSGRPMVRTVSYINLELGIQITVTTVAVAKDTEGVQKIARQFMSSWWVMQNSER